MEKTFNGELFSFKKVAPDMPDTLASAKKRGDTMGFECLKPLIYLKAGSTTYIYAPPHTGKTSFLMEIMDNISKGHNKNWLIFSPELGNEKEAYLEICSFMCRKPIDRLTSEDIKSQENYIHKHFTVLTHAQDEDSDITLDDIFNAYHFIKKTGRNIDYILIDPMNEVSIKWGAESRDETVNKWLGKFRRFNEKNGTHGILVTHTSSQKDVKKKGKFRINGVETEGYYYPPAHPDYILHGQSLWRKGHNMISLWRPPIGLIDESSPAQETYPDNVLFVVVQKVRPKWIGKLGTAQLYLASDSNRFYEIMPDGRKEFAWGYVE